MIVFFTSPPLSWRTAIARTCSFSRITHCVPCSGGYVLERCWHSLRIVKAEVYCRRFPHRLLAVEAGGEVEFPGADHGHRPYPLLAVLRKRIRGPKAPWADDCVGLTCELLVRAGVSVPGNVSTPPRLLNWLSRRYPVEDLG